MLTLKRKKPLKRTPLKRGDNELKRTPLKRGDSQLKRSKMKKKKPRVNRNFPPEWRDVLMEKFKGLCQECGRPFDSAHPHHKKYKSQGGSGDLSNAAWLCQKCHTNTHIPPDEEWRIRTMKYRTPSWAPEGKSEEDYPEIYLRSDDDSSR